MPIDPRLAAAATQSGLSAVCATCTRYWEARDRLLPEPQCLSTTRCGSPLAGGSFHDYLGPLTDLTKLCFVCAGPPKYGVRTTKTSKLVGVCRKHVRLLRELQPVQGPAATVLIQSSGATLRPEDLLPGGPKKSLIEEMIDFEEEFG